jgi:hypothetical protein
VFRNIDARSLTEFADAVAKLTLAKMMLPDKSARGVAHGRRSGCRTRTRTPPSSSQLSDFGAGVFVARGTYLTSLVGTQGIAGAASTIVGAVGSAGAATAVYLGLFLEASAGAPASQLTWFVGLVDTASVLPFLPNGGDIQILWDNSVAPTRVFKL